MSEKTYKISRKTDMNILLFFYSSTSFFISTASATINNNYNFISFFRIIKLINKKRYFCNKTINNNNR